MNVYDRCFGRTATKKQDLLSKPTTFTQNADHGHLCVEDLVSKVFHRTVESSMGRPGKFFRCQVEVVYGIVSVGNGAPIELSVASI